MKHSGKTSKEILVIDDDEDTQNFLKKILETAGFQYGQADNVENGVLAIQKQAPHLILLDYKLGEESGFEVIKFLKSHSAYSRIPVFMISATVSKKLVISSIAAGANEFIGKPLKPNTLLQRIKKILKQHELPILKFKENPKVSARSIGELIKINEMGLILQSSIKFTGKSSLFIKSDFLKVLGASPCRTNTAAPAVVANPGVYRNEVLFQGMDEKTARNIRNIKTT